MIRPTVTERITAAEMQRRHAATRAAMAQRHLDALLVAGQGPHIKLGHLRYLTNFCQPLFEEYFLLPLKGEPIYFSRYTLRRNLQRKLLGLNARCPEYGSGLEQAKASPGSLTSNIPPAFVVAGIREVGARRVGICGPECMAGDFYVALLEELRAADIHFETASDILWKLRMIKSPEEQRWLRESVRVASLGFEVFKGVIAPGRREYEVFAEVEHAQQSAGAECAFYMMARGAEPLLKFPDLAYEPYEKGDLVFFNTETAGPGGYYTQLIRTLVLGEADAEYRQTHEVAREAQAVAARKLVPGNRMCDVYDAYVAFTEKHGYDTRNHHPGHGQGLDVFEAPLVSPHDETVIQPGMMITIHPGLLTPSGTRKVWTGDSYIVTAQGAELLYATSNELVEIPV